MWDDVRDGGAVGFVGAGAMVSMLWNLPPDPRDAQLPLRFISAAPIAADSYRGIEQRYGCRIVTMYGMTEAFPIAVKTRGRGRRPRHVGPAECRTSTCAIVDADGNAVLDGVGEITCRRNLTRGHESGLRRGVRPTCCACDPHQEWFRTGDLGRIDADGNLTYVDRVKDSIRRRGENVSSVEVETVVMGHPAVAEAAAVGVPSELGEDDILSCSVTLRPGPSVDYAELLDFCAARMPYFCVPRYVRTVPRTAAERRRADTQGPAARGGHRARQLGP